MARACRAQALAAIEFKPSATIQTLFYFMSITDNPADFAPLFRPD